MMRDLVVATRNPGKLREIREILHDVPFNVLGLDSFPDAPDVVEDADSFAGNAEKKAMAIAVHTGSLTLADDSGLAVDVLNGAPGVFSARYSGDDATDSSNNLKLLNELSGVKRADRQAAFHCAMVLVDPENSRTLHFSGCLKGVILEAQQGDNGFGYDPLFLVREYGVTLAQLSSEVKNRISHRGQALRALLDSLQVKG
jgi:XTP/dITP diphosphohydrolase